jgi:hypothetical protein
MKVNGFANLELLFLKGEVALKLSERSPRQQEA